MLTFMLFAVRICVGDDSHDDESHDDESHDHDDILDPSSGRIRDAILLSLLAGMSTVLGAAFAFCTKKENLMEDGSIYLAGCMSFAAAAMVYVSLVELWPHALSEFEEVAEEQLAHIYTSLSFFGGMLLGWISSKAIHFLDEFRLNHMSTLKLKDTWDVNTESGVELSSPSVFDASRGKEVDAEVEVISEAKDRKSRLLRTGLSVALSIALHNFPEGIATFLAAVEDWKVGVATAFAIAMHNIPEGISIAVPYYHASGSRWKAFALAFLSGVAEPIGALVGWGILGSIWGHSTFGVMFGLTAGVMVYISFIDLLPVARKNDPKEKVTSVMIIAGMTVMDLSLVIAGDSHSH